MDPALARISKFLSLVLRHDPARVGLELDAGGWIDVEDLLRAAARAGFPFDHATLVRVITENDKQRFALSPDGVRIRANQGHSVPVDLGLSEVTPPAELFHGTADRFLASIRREGLNSRSRNHVHLSADEATARKVGQRHGRPVVLRVDAAAMSAAGHRFWRSENGVWLAERVPAEFLSFPAD